MNQNLFIKMSNTNLNSKMHYCCNILNIIFLDLHGYIVKFWQDESKAGNKFIDVTLRTSIDHDCTTIGIMRNNNPNVAIAYIEELKNASNLLHFANLSPSNGVYFFNSHRKSTIQISHQVYFQNAGTDHLIDDQVY